MPDERPKRHPRYLTSEDVRHYILDRCVADNSLDNDLTFSDEEIRDAMFWCARDYNSIPPYGISNVFGNRLPNTTTCFLFGTIKHLYLIALQRLLRNDMEYDAGGVNTSIYGKRIEHFTDQAKYFGDQFLEIATAWKRNLNIRRCYGKIG